MATGDRKRERSRREKKIGHANESQTSITSRIGHGQVRESPLFDGGYPSVVPHRWKQVWTSGKRRPRDWKSEFFFLLLLSRLWFSGFVSSLISFDFLPGFGEIFLLNCRFGSVSGTARGDTHEIQDLSMEVYG